MSHVYEPMAGENISTCCERMVALVKEHGEVTAEFNGVPLKATTDTTQASILEDFNIALVREKAAWEASPEFAEQKAKREIELANKQMKLDSFVDELGADLDLNDDVKVLTWWYGYAPLSDDTGIRTRWEEVIKIFREHDWEPNVNLGTNCNIEDTHNYAAYIVGQALACLLSMGSVHHVCTTFIEKWMAKFHPEKQL